MALKALHTTSIPSYTIWAARLVVLAAFLDLFMQFSTMAPHARQLGASTVLVGVIVAAYSVTNLFGNLGAGFVLDRWGRRSPMIIGMAVTALAVFSYSLVQTPGQLMAARAVHGIGAAVLAPGAFSIIGDRAAPGQHRRVMGLTGALIAMAALIGPPIAGILRDAWGSDAVFLVDSAFLVMTLAAFLLITRDASLNSHLEKSGPRATPLARHVEEPRPLVGVYRCLRSQRGHRGSGGPSPIGAARPRGDGRAGRLQLCHVRAGGDAGDGQPRMAQR